MHTIQGLLQRLEASKSRFSAPVESAPRSQETRVDCEAPNPWMPGNTINAQLNQVKEHFGLCTCIVDAENSALCRLRAFACVTLLRSLQEPLAICQLYRSLGPAMVAKLQGDFAFVLHDSRLVRSSLCWPAHRALPKPALTSCHTLMADLHDPKHCFLCVNHVWHQSTTCCEHVLNLKTLRATRFRAAMLASTCRGRHWQHAQLAQQAQRPTCSMH